MAENKKTSRWYGNGMGMQNIRTTSRPSAHAKKTVSKASKPKKVK